MWRGRSERLRRKTRQQKGVFHIILNSNFQVNIFEDSQDTNKFLELFQRYAPGYSGKMLGYSIMNTHVHLIIEVDGLSKFMGIWLRVFSKYRNKKHKTKGNIFTSPFNSIELFSNKSRVDTLFYLYFNPFVEGMCKHPKDFNKCSFKVHYCTNQRFNIDSTLLKLIYPHYKDFEKAFWQYVKLKEANSKGVGKTGRMEELPVGSGTGYRAYAIKRRNTDEQILEYRNKILEGRNIMHLPLKEIDEIIIKLSKETYANKRQIASATMTTYEYVRRIFNIENPYRRY